MKIQIISKGYEESRLEFFQKQRDAASRRMEYWCKPGAADRVGVLEAHDRASEAGAEVSYYKDAINALQRNGVVIPKDTMQYKSLHYLYGQLRKARIAYGHAEDKPNSADELANLQTKIDVLEWVIGVVIKEDEDENA